MKGFFLFKFYNRKQELTMDIAINILRQKTVKFRIVTLANHVKLILEN